MSVIIENALGPMEPEQVNSLTLVDDDDYFFIIPAWAIKSAIMRHSFIVAFCFHIEFHRMATIINYCELKKLKILKGDYCYTRDANFQG